MSRKSIGTFFLALMISFSSLIYAASSDKEQVELVASEEFDVMAVNPVPRNQQSIGVGKEIYVKKCLSCHGETGTGDGPLAESLPEKLPDLRDIERVGGQRDGELFLKISDGMGENMPAYKDVLEEEQIWHAVNYIRALPEEKTIELTQEATAEPELEKEGKLKYVFIALALIVFAIAGYAIRKKYMK
ncbi:MAG: c-type cytochrome [Candidatus Hydrothermarchaeales archaeon]